MSRENREKKWIRMARETIYDALKSIDEGNWDSAMWMLAESIQRLIEAHRTGEFKEE